MPTTFNQLVAKERQRQIDLGYDAEHDDKHGVDRLNAMARKYEQDGDFVKGQAMRRAAAECELRRKARQP